MNKKSPSLSAGSSKPKTHTGARPTYECPRCGEQVERLFVDYDALDSSCMVPPVACSTCHPSRSIFRSGFIYLLRRSSDGAFKIGMSGDPTRRLSQIRADPFHRDQTVDLLNCRSVESMRKSEKGLHVRWKKFKVPHYPEWFSIPADMMGEFLESFRECR